MPAFVNHSQLANVAVHCSAGRKQLARLCTASHKRSGLTKDPVALHLQPDACPTCHRSLLLANIAVRCSAGRQQLSRLSTAQPNNSSTAKQALEALDPVTIAKAHKLSIPVGLLAGVFGSFVGVGGGVLIVPLLTGACKGLPQR